MAMAQEPLETPLEEPNQEGDASPSGEAPPSGEGSPSDLEQQPVPIPASVQGDTESLGGQSFIDDVFRSSRNPWGFSLGAYQAYTTDVAMGNEPQTGSGISAFMPRVFFNIGKRRSTFHLDMGAGYRFYNSHEDLNSWDYDGNAQYSYRFSRRTSFKLNDQFTSAFNDSWSFLSFNSPIYYNQYNPNNEVLFARQRINRNALMAELSHQASRKSRFGLFGGYRMYKYSQDEMVDSDAFELGGSFYYQLAKWLFLSSSFSTYINISGQSYPDEKIYRVQAGGLEFHLSKSWRVWANGGIDITDYQGYHRYEEDINTGIGYSSQNVSFMAAYQRGFTSAIGISMLLSTDIASATFGYRINRWMNAKLESYYYRSLEGDGNGLLETYSGGGGFEFALRRDLTLTMNAYYQNQSTRDFSVQGLGLNRLTAYLGLQYVWPARRNPNK